ncbi:COG4 transport protein-domain-containing protein [Abortiporus biennis]|nr:COG4 transport protein-domain-containing protein [Abortiporus biennis]
MTALLSPSSPLLSPSRTTERRLPPNTLTTLPSILSSLSSLESEESSLSTSLSSLLSQQQPIQDSLERLKGLEGRFGELVNESSVLEKVVLRTAGTAGRVGGRVRGLDEEMKRVREAGEWVGVVLELKSSLTQMQISIDNQDWESATRHCARAMSLPTHIISGPFAESAVPTPSSHLPPLQTLQTAREELLEVFKSNFLKASRERDSTSTSRFFKLFPAIGWEKEGLEVYAEFVVELVGRTSSPLYYITSLTALFESIAMIVDQHQPVVEKYYGKGKMGSVIIERLLKECCDRVCGKVVDGWEEERGMKRKARAGGVDDEGVDPREIDKVLTEASGMAGRWGLFRKFLIDRLREEDDYDEVDNRMSGERGRKDGEDDDEGEAQKESSGADEQVLGIVEHSESQKIFEGMLEKYYYPMEIWYTRTIIEKAHRLSSTDPSQVPLTTTTPDDVFYILKIVLSRLLTSGSVKIVGKISETLGQVMEKDYAGVIKRKLDDVFRIGGSGGGGGGIGMGQREKEGRTAFIILLNDLDLSSSHMERLIRDITSSELISQHFLERDVESVRKYISSFNNVIPRFRSILRAGIEQLFNQLLRPKLRTLITDIYKDVSYVLDDDSYAVTEYNDVVRKRFVKAWEGLIDGYKDTFAESNYRLFFGLALDVLVRPWEKFVMSMKYSELGAIRFDRDLRAMTSYLFGQTAFGDVRDKFVRLQQISTLLNLDTEEDVEEFFNGSGIAWKLSANEARIVAALRV